MDRKIRILMLEDRISDADLLEYELQEAGISFTSLRTEKEKDYIRALQEFSPDIILADYDLPQYTGSLALVAAKKLSPEIPFILVTGAITETNGLCHDIVAQGANECVLKDHLERLAPVIRKVLGMRNGNDNTVGKRESSS
jgi:CheY-like chemotaxis protein